MCYQDGKKDVARLGSRSTLHKLAYNFTECCILCFNNITDFFPIVCPNNHPCCVDMVSHFYSVPVNILMTVITNIMLLIIVLFMPSFAVVRHAHRERPMSGVW